MPVNKTHCDFLIIVPPAGPRHGNYPPYGAMYIASALGLHDYKVSILNVDAERCTNKEVIDRLREIKPSHIGFSGIVAPSYRYIKDLSLDIRAAFPDKLQILGGGLSSAAETVLNNTSVDIVVYGEGDQTAVEMMDCLKDKADLNAVKGLYYKDGDRIVFSGKRPLFANLDQLPYPAFDLIDMDEYLPDGARFIRTFTDNVRDKRIGELLKDGRNRMITLMTSRGCFGKCSFCFRAYPGLRPHSLKYIFDYIDYCIGKFNVGFFTFADECFAANKARNWAFIEEFKKRRPDIVFRILGMRVDTVDRDILRAYKEIGCWMIEYGFESGSQRMLNIMDKEVTVEQNRDAFLWTTQAGIFTMPTAVLAMPGETNETMGRTIGFLKSLNLDFKQYQWSYALPIPGSHLYDYAKISGAIEDDDAYLYSLAGPVGHVGVFHINLTDEPNEVVAGWDDRIRDELDSHFFNSRFNYKNKLMTNLARLLALIGLHYRKGDLLSVVFKKLRHTAEITKKGNVRKTGIIFRKKYNIPIEDFVRNTDCAGVDRAAALKNINQRLREMAVPS